MRRLIDWFLIVFLISGCGGASTDPGLGALLRVQNAQYVSGAPPDSSNGPMILALNNSANVIIPGQTSKPLSGVVPREATAVALYLVGDRGYWLITPGAIDPTALGQLGFSTSLSFSPELPPGDYLLAGRAIDAQGRFGAPLTAKLTAMSAQPAGTLVISLSWAEDADLDLHVLTPDGVEIWAKKGSSYEPPPPGQTGDPEALANAGVLDFDSNAQCVIDGRRLEDVYWTVPPPQGHYLARVDAFSLCGQPQAEWTLTATLDGAELGRAHGTAHDPDTWPPHIAGAGVTALQFDIP